MRVSEAELQYFGAVVEVAIGPDYVGRILVEDLKERPGSTKWKVDWSLLEDRCSCFLSQSNAKTGVLEGFEMTES